METLNAPGYWMHETSGVLRPVIMDYLHGHPLDARACATMRAYLRQWIMAPAWRGPEVARLRAKLDGLTSRKAISEWLAEAENAGIDPL